MQFVLPSKYRKMAIQGCHDDVGHMGVAQSVNLLQDQFYWPGMAKEMTQHVRKCMRCNCFTKRAEWAPLEPILATHPMQIVHIDFLTIESGKNRQRPQCVGGHRPVYQICAGICYHFPNCPNYC